ncbi:MAG: beta-N-acetylhexosaminidase [Actinobacteria bacterium]|nr:beta-N-acetylhexosaminidase [Actinomycetota bacterium]
MTGTVVAGSFASLVPTPTSVEPGTGTLVLGSDTVVVAPSGGRADDAIALLRTAVGASSGLDLPVRTERDVADGPSITFVGPADPDALGEEGYELSITNDGVEVRAGSHDGFVWAVQTLLQALPAEAVGPSGGERSFALPVGVVRDAPRYPWRGAMLDVARHFFGPDDVEAFVDLLSAYKLNRLHLHLSDDQGWRIEIRAHPELAEVGGASAVGGGPGGSFIQEQYRGIVEYARRRGVTVVPEIDTPGHTNAALHAVPALNGDGSAPEAYRGVRVGFSSLCVTDEFTFEWWDDVVRELAALTPGRWIHLGGDESNATEHEDYRRYVARASRIVVDHGKVPIGWEEIGAADLPDGTIAQHWLDPAKAVAAAGRGASLVLSPASHTYLDICHVEGGPGNPWAGTVSARDVYDWDPATLLDGVPDEQVLGVEGPLWTELVEDRATIQERTIPRLPALAEVGWSEQSARCWDEFRARISVHAERWDLLHWAWTRDAGIDWPP